MISKNFRRAGGRIRSESVFERAEFVTCLLVLRFFSFSSLSPLYIDLLVLVPVLVSGLFSGFVLVLDLSRRE